MSKWALIAGGVVHNVIVDDAQPNIPPYTVVDVTALHVGPGYLYDGANFSPPVVWGWMKAREFLREFNRNDRQTIKQSVDSVVVDAMWQLELNGIIDFADPDMQQFMDQLVTLNIISNAKKNRIYASARFTDAP